MGTVKIMLLVQVFEVGRYDKRSANISVGDNENPKGGSSSTPVTKLRILPRVTFSLLPANLNKTKALDSACKVIYYD